MYAALSLNIIRSLGIAGKAPDAGVTPAVAYDQASAGSSSTLTASVGSTVGSGALTGSLSSTSLSRIVALDNIVRIASTTAVTVTAAPGQRWERTVIYWVRFCSGSMSTRVRFGSGSCQFFKWRVLVLSGFFDYHGSVQLRVLLGNVTFI